MPRRPSPTRSARVGAGKTKVDWNDSADSVRKALETGPELQTFYCATGDHLVDEVIWLEQLALGCKNCMIKLRDTLTKDRDINMRFWRGNPDGTLTQISVDPQKPLMTNKTEAVAPTKGEPEWICTVCSRSCESKQGYFNTAFGFVCKECAPTHKRRVLSDDPMTRYLAEMAARPDRSPVREWTVPSRKNLPTSPAPRSTFYVKDEKIVVTWIDGTWVRVAIPKR
ncbi:hypothetical protein SEA_SCOOBYDOOBYDOO_140 [Mycobacterium phage ScoobyDoobyDoo]|nr:hypothetical protein SEA_SCOOBYDOOBYDOO_140 [Mycobacterium phage ScoobyDoobyDoo]